MVKHAFLDIFSIKISLTLENNPFKWMVTTKKCDIYHKLSFHNGTLTYILFTCEHTHF